MGKNCCSGAAQKSRTLERKIMLSSLKQGEMNVIRFDDHLTVLAFWDGQNLKVIHDMCPHMGGPLSQGKYCKKTDMLLCPWHGYRFSPKTMTFVDNPNEKIWIKPLAGEDHAVYETPHYKLREVPFRREGDFAYIEEKA